MTDNMKQFYEKVSKDEALKAELDAALQGVAEENQSDAVIAFAKEKGFALTQVDFMGVNEDLNLEELENVTGGGKCRCDLSGSGSGDGLQCSCDNLGGGRVPGGRVDICDCFLMGTGKLPHFGG